MILEPELRGWNECPIGRLSFLSREERERVTRKERDGTLKGGNGDRVRAQGEGLGTEKGKDLSVTRLHELAQIPIWGFR